jgi:hypothetical protein
MNFQMPSLAPFRALSWEPAPGSRVRGRHHFAALPPDMFGTVAPADGTRYRCIPHFERSWPTGNALREASGRLQRDSRRDGTIFTTEKCNESGNGTSGGLSAVGLLVELPNGEALKGEA